MARRRRRARKPPEAKPEFWFLRSQSGTPARLKKTSKTRGGLWVYRLDYGNVVGHQEWTLPELQAVPGILWLRRPPNDWMAEKARRMQKE